MTSVTSADFQKNFGTYKKEALVKPVVISIHGKDTLVLLSKQEFDRLNVGGLPAQAQEDAPIVVSVEATAAVEPGPAAPEQPPAISPEQFKALEAMLSRKSGVRFAEQPS